MRIALAQLDCVVGDMAGNAARILGAIDDAQRGAADLVVTPELSLCGYPPEDLLLRPAFLDACAREIQRLAEAVQGPTLLVGFPQVASGKCYNAVAALGGGHTIAVYRKQQLPNYTVFDEERYFQPGGEPCVIDVAGIRVGIVICEDVCFSGPALATRNYCSQLLIVPNC